jgi:phosphoheptose isomerase
VRNGAAAVDALHAASMLTAAVAWPRYRRPALTSAALAAGSAVVTVAGRDG